MLLYEGEAFLHFFPSSADFIMSEGVHRFSDGRKNSLMMFMSVALNSIRIYGGSFHLCKRIPAYRANAKHVQ